MNETLKRLISGVIYVILLITSILYSTESFITLFGLFMLIAVYEFCNLVKLNKAIALLLALSVYLIFHQFSFSRTNMQLVLLATILTSFKCIHFLFSSKNDKIDLSSKYIYLIGYIILPFTIMAKIPFGRDGYNPKIFIGIFILIWTNDTFAYIVGKSMGKRKLFERISPKKTVEGFLGGMIFAIIASFLISKYYIEGSIINQYIWLGFAFIASIFGTIGDLVESKFKRIAGVKDSGIIMPGHGGVLDRLDSVIFVAPFIYLFYQILYYVS